MPVDQTLAMEREGVVLVRLRWQGTVLHKTPGQTFEISLVWLFEEYLFHWYIFWHQIMEWKCKTMDKFYFGFVINKGQNTTHMHKNYRFKAYENNIRERSGGMKTFQLRGGALIFMVFAHNVQWKHFLVRNTFNIFFKSVNLI